MLTNPFYYITAKKKKYIYRNILKYSYIIIYCLSLLQSRLVLNYLTTAWDVCTFFHSDNFKNLFTFFLNYSKINFKLLDYSKFSIIEVV